MIDFNKEFDRRNTNTWKWDGEGKGCDYPLGTADMDFEMPIEVKKAILDKVNQGILSYAADKTYLAKAFSEYQKKHHNIEIDSQWVIPGTALMAVYKVILEAFTAPGDGVIVQTPVYGPLYTVAKNNGRLIYDNALKYSKDDGSWTIDFESLNKQASDPRVKLLVVCNPGNPITKAFTREELQEIYNIGKENNVIILCDEIHSEVYFDGRKHVSLIEVADEEGDNAIVLTSAGKVFGVPGLKTAITVIKNKGLREQFLVANTNAKMDVIDLGLIASSEGYLKCEYYIDKLNAYLQENKNIVVDWFSENDINVRISKPEASYLLWLDFTSWGKTCNQIEELLKEYGVVLSSGNDFGGDFNEGFMRMNIATTHDRVKDCLNMIKKCYEEKIMNV